MWSSSAPSTFRKKNSDNQISSSRPKLELWNSDYFISEDDIKDRAYHNEKLKATSIPHKDLLPLTNEVKGIQLTLKTVKNPPRSYYKLMDTTNGT